MIRIFFLIIIFSIIGTISNAQAQEHPANEANEPTSLVKWMDFKTAFAENNRLVWMVQKDDENNLQQSCNCSIHQQLFLSRKI